LSTLPGATPTVSGGNSTLTASGLAVDGLTVVSTLLASTGGTIAQFDNVTFQSQPATGTALTISHAGTAAPFAFNNIKFTTIPTSGAYVRATDTAPSDGNVLTINLVNATPSNGSAATVTSGGAVVNWLPPSAPRRD
jgi:hypothetical protein